jgi:hypothetical protein
VRPKRSCARLVVQKTTKTSYFYNGARTNRRSAGPKVYPWALRGRGETGDESPPKTEACNRTFWKAVVRCRPIENPMYDAVQKCKIAFVNPEQFEGSQSAVPLATQRIDQEGRLRPKEIPCDCWRGEASPLLCQEANNLHTRGTRLTLSSTFRKARLDSESYPTLVRTLPLAY